MKPFRASNRTVVGTNTNLGGARGQNLVTVTSAGTLIVRDKLLNLSQLGNAGIDAELSYTTPLFDGDFSFRLIANRLLKAYNQPPAAARTELLGHIIAGMPKWSGLVQVRYATGPFAMFLQERYIGKGELDPNYVVGVDISESDQTVPAVFYTDTTVTFDINEGKQQLYVTVNNLFDKEPPLSPAPVTSFSFPAATIYDQVGRYFTAGFRAKF